MMKFKFSKVLFILFLLMNSLFVMAKDKNVPADTSKLVWPPPPAQARIQYLQEIKNEFDIGAKKKNTFIDKLAGKSQDVLWLNRPVSVAFDPQGNLFVGDIEQGVIMFDFKNKKVINFSKSSGRFLGVPVGVAADSNLVVACDANSNSVVVFDKNGQFISALTEANGINHPVGVAIDETRDLIIVVNQKNNELLLLNKQLKLLKKIGKRGGGPSEFNFPTYVTFIKDKGFAVVDTGNFRVQIFDYNGKFISEFGKAGDVSGMFSRPKGIAADPDGNLYVTDANFCNFQIFREDGQVLTFVGEGGSRPGKFSAPTGIAISNEGIIAVADQFNQRVQLFKYLGEKGGDTKAGIVK
jgi:DNA-binding beta-propeller fold protein YncE